MAQRKKRRYVKPEQRKNGVREIWIEKGIANSPSADAE